MFSFVKKPAVQEVILHDLTEEQLTQVAGGNCKDSWKNDHDADDKKKKKHHHHHHHHHHHYAWKNDHDADDK